MVALLLKQHTNTHCGFEDLGDIHSPATLLGAVFNCFFFLSPIAYQPITWKQLVHFSIVGMVICWEKRGIDAALNVVNMVVVGGRQAAGFTNG